MAMSFRDLKRKKRHDDGNKGKEPLRDKNEVWDEILNPFRSAKKESYDEGTDTVPVDEEGSEIEEMVEGEAGHTAEEKMGEGDHEVSEDEPLPAFLEKEELEGEEGFGEKGEYPEDDEEAESEEDLPLRKKRRKKAVREEGPMFRRYL